MSRKHTISLLGALVVGGASVALFGLIGAAFVGVVLIVLAGLIWLVWGG
ncbi:gp83 [Rhodococcus phage ReqiPine5]|uniref:Gp83 n=1 Tax=Rhodococcus phage ReqiPine5 TaxID=691963 RepID=D4P858_9CAUD|nr:gp83 [Rhodococcus phage ReqiPine5]ADD81188.1 gp83 [Rhodococcus phage ReqiPine5]